jgi:puromycin-sensitive aminopeptidase
MEPTSETNGTNGTKTVKFAPTPIMSTYLLAFIVGEFEVVEGKTKEGTLVRVFTPLGKKSTGTFALDVGIKVLSYFNEYYGIPYPLKKCDHVAISDFSAGAMEYVLFVKTNLSIETGV